MSSFKIGGTVIANNLVVTSGTTTEITNLAVTTLGCTGVLTSTNSDLTYITGVSVFTGTSVHATNVYTSNIESQTGALNIATADSSVSTVNLATSNSVQTVNIGTVGSGQTTVNIGGPGDTVNVSGTLVYVNSTVTEITNP